MALAEGGVETPSFLPFLGGVECPRPDRHTLGPPTPKEEELGVPHPISGVQKGSWQEGVWATGLLNEAGRPGGRGPGRASAEREAGEQRMDLASRVPRAGAEGCECSEA